MVGIPLEHGEFNSRYSGSRRAVRREGGDSEESGRSGWVKVGKVGDDFDHESLGAYEKPVGYEDVNITSRPRFGGYAVFTAIFSTRPMFPAPARVRSAFV